MSLQPGDVFAGYTIERELGSGGMGSVYLARHPRLPRMDALKLLRPELCSDASFVARFEREADMVARLDHPNIVSVHDRGSQDGQLWISMRFIDGTNAEQALRDEPAGMPPERVVRIIGKVASALDYAHRHGLLHRDVKPANILLTPGPEDEDELERVFLSDFGVAKAIGEASDSMSSLTSTGSVVATLDYASPEQIKGQALDHRSDIYALGCVLYKLLTGDVPYPAESVVARVYGHLNKEIPRPTDAVPSLPSGLDDVVAMAMAKERDERYQTCRAMAVAARAALTTAPGPAAARAVPDDSLPTTVYAQSELGPRSYPGSPSGRGPSDTGGAATQEASASPAPSVEGLATVASAVSLPGGEPSAMPPGPADPGRAVSGPDVPASGDGQPWDARQGDAAQAPPRRTLEQPAFDTGPQQQFPQQQFPRQQFASQAPPPPQFPPGSAAPDRPGPPRAPRRWVLITAIVAGIVVVAAVGTWFVVRNGTAASPGSVTPPLTTAQSTAATGSAANSPGASASTAASPSPAVSSAASPSPAVSSAVVSSALVIPPAGPVPGLPHSTPLTDQVLIGSRIVDGSSNLYLYEASTGEIGQQLTTGSPGTQFPVLSPDRGSVIYVQTRQGGPKTLRTVAVDGSGDRELFSTFPDDCGNFYRPGWNPVDQSEIALACVRADGSVAVYRMSVDGKVNGTITTGLTVVDDLTYSPDGSTLAYWGAEAPGGQSALFVQPADGSSPPRRVVDVPDGAKDVDPVFSPDATTLTFRRVTKDGNGKDTSRLFQVGVDGSNLRPLTDAGYLDLDPSYSPDGNDVAFRSIGRPAPGGGASELWVIAADGTRLRPLAAGAPGVADSAPAWTRR